MTEEPTGPDPGAEKKDTWADFWAVEALMMIPDLIAGAVRVVVAGTVALLSSCS